MKTFSFPACLAVKSNSFGWQGSSPTELVVGAAGEVLIQHRIGRRGVSIAALFFSAA